MKEMLLWDNLRARRGDPETSHEAMAVYDREKMENAVNCVIHLYRENGPMADYQLKELFSKTWGDDCSPHLYRQARSMARDRGSVVATDEWAINPISNRRQIIWAYCDDPHPVVIRHCPTCGKIIGRS